MTSLLTTGCEAVNEHIASPIPEKLWHYTTYAALHGIFTSKKMWATEYRFLNDREEFNHAKTLAQDLIAEEPEMMDYEFPAREYLQKGINLAFNTGPLHEERLRIMVASFSASEDQLSQWRGYAGSSTGVSVSFDLRGLRPPVTAQTTVVLAPCLYKEDDKRSVLKAVFAHYLKSLHGWWTVTTSSAKAKAKETSISEGFGQTHVAEHIQALQTTLQLAQTELLFDLMRIAPLLKNESFAEENEWRLVLPSETIQLPMRHPIEFRPIRDALVPYVAFPLLLSGQDGEVPCNDLILGPGSHPSAEIGMRMLLQSKLIPLQARASKVPYRPT